MLKEHCLCFFVNYKNKGDDNKVDNNNVDEMTTTKAYWCNRVCPAQGWVTVSQWSGSLSLSTATLLQSQNILCHCYLYHTEVCYAYLTKVWCHKVSCGTMYITLLLCGICRNLVQVSAPWNIYCCIHSHVSLHIVAVYLDENCDCI